MYLHTFFTKIIIIIIFACSTVLFKTKVLCTLYKCSKMMVDTFVKIVLMGVENSLPGMRIAVKVHFQTIQYPNSLRSVLQCGAQPCNSEV